MGAAVPLTEGVAAGRGRFRLEKWIKKLKWSSKDTGIFAWGLFPLRPSGIPTLRVRAFARCSGFSPRRRDRLSPVGRIGLGAAEDPRI